MPHPHSGASAGRGDVVGDDGVTSTTSWNITGQCSNSPYTGEEGGGEVELTREGGGERGRAGGADEGGREGVFDHFPFSCSVPAALWTAQQVGTHGCHVSGTLGVNGCHMTCLGMASPYIT